MPNVTVSFRGFLGNCSSTFSSQEAAELWLRQIGRADQIRNIRPVGEELPVEEEQDPYAEEESRPCAECGTPIESCELCFECAQNNEPFFTSKYR